MFVCPPLKTSECLLKMRSPKKEAVGEWRYACRLPQMRSLKEGAV
jgi:hypothetical protein